MLYPCAQPRKAARRRGKTAADGGLHIAAGIGIGNDPARKFRDLLVIGAFGEQRPQRKYPLHRLGHENRPVRKPLGALAGDGADRDLRLFFLMAVAFMRLRFARAHEHGEDRNKGCRPAPAAQRDGREQRPHERAAQHEKNRNHADMAARRRIAWCCALRGSGRSLNRQRQDVGGVSRRDRENQVRTPALGEPRRCHAGMCRRRPPQL